MSSTKANTKALGKGGERFPSAPGKTQFAETTETAIKVLYEEAKPRALLPLPGHGWLRWNGSEEPGQ